MGPIELADTSASTSAWKSASSWAAQLRPPKRLMELVYAGNLGKKSGRGFY
jgi:3-hydroxyacyl-CoA dehydrogenase/enoyl-CoA hydratase/3-hydroxybutyryl-CoA epimerase